MLLIIIGIMGCIGIGAAWIFQIQPKIVLSGSMEPEIKTGSIVLIRENIPPEEIRERDVIAFQASDQMEVLHRVISVKKDQKVFRTKGDANKVADPGAVRFEQYRGKEVFSLPYLGYVIRFLQKDEVFISLIVLICLTGIWNVFTEMKRRYKNKELI